MDDVEEIEHALTRWTKYGIDLPRTARLELCTVSMIVMCSGLLTEAAFQRNFDAKPVVLTAVHGLCLLPAR